MRLSLHNRLLHRELGSPSKSVRPYGIYGDRAWVKDLDIVNELVGHNGCVNALSWARSGRLLASGSDDTNVLIHEYLPGSTSSQFALATTLTTGHTRNIFSVKFMPHSNDRTIVTAAGDGEVRIFDLERSGRSSHVSPAGADARVFLSHGDRVKRIVTESSPFYFITCSEDGEVRQWDVRQPSSAYPAPRGFRGSRTANRVPPPLISYGRHHVELNTISCSPSQPHYIALGGSHLHCFLHDRRMLGRDRLAETGSPSSSPGHRSDHDDELMGEATQCVRKFAPDGKRKMKGRDNGHITACKISDYNPNEMIVSWSGDWIYSFDLVSSPDAREQDDGSRTASTSASGNGNVRAKGKEAAQRKRKRLPTGSQISQEGTDRGISRVRTQQRPRRGQSSDEMALMVQYENGQSEEIPIQSARSGSPIPLARETLLSESELQSFRLSKSVVKLRKKMFTLGEPRHRSPSDSTGHSGNFTSVLCYAAEILPQMDEIIRTWRYPVNPDELDVAVQNQLRQKREGSRHFVQAAGTLARLLGGRLQTAGSDSSVLLDRFAQISVDPTRPQIPGSAFCYDFLKAIVLWLDSGIGAVLQGFTIPERHTAKHRNRYPIPADASAEAIDDFLIPYLLRSAGDRSIPNVDASRFEVDENSLAFTSEKVAILAFARALKIPFEDLSSAVVVSSSTASSTPATSTITAQDRNAAIRFWALKVGRGVLMNAGEGVNFTFVDQAFGGIGRPDESVRDDEAELRQRWQHIDPDEEDDVVETAQLVRRRGSGGSQEADGDETQTAEDAHETSNAEANSEPNSDEVLIPLSDIREATEELAEPDAGDEDEGDADGNDEDDENDEDESEESESDENAELLYSANRRTRMREDVHPDVPCSTHMRTYRGHCNVKTVKDVNFFGLQDEYVVSGSDSGHVFIWDRKTSELVNILEGDGEVVNVIQGHPYEPMLAVSGIDHTVKIFSPDSRDRSNARHGIGVQASDPTAFSSISSNRRRRPDRPNRSDSNGTSNPSADPRVPSHESDDEDTVAPNGLTSRKRMHKEYEITSQNDQDRQSGGRDAYVTRRLLMQLAQHIRQHEGAGGGDHGDGEGPTRTVNLDDCAVM